MTIRERAERIVRRVERLNANNLHKQVGDIDDAYRVAQSYLELLEVCQNAFEQCEEYDLLPSTALSLATAITKARTGGA